MQARELEDFCFKFSLNHMTAVTQTDSFAKLDEATLKDFITKVVFLVPKKRGKEGFNEFEVSLILGLFIEGLRAELFDIVPTR